MKCFDTCPQCGIIHPPLRPGERCPLSPVKELNESHIEDAHAALVKRFRKKFSESGVVKDLGAKGMRDKRKPDIVHCPRCDSTQITAVKKGFGLGKALLGAVLIGSYGLLGGAIGSGKIKAVCVNCGHTWNAGSH